MLSDMQSKVATADYHAFVDRQIRMHGPWATDFLDLPYAEVVAIAKSAAAETGPHHLSATANGFTLEMPGEKLTPPDRRLDIKTQKILNLQLFAGQVISHFGAIERASLEQAIQFSGRGHLDDAIRTGRPVCLLNSHVGRGQLAPLFLARMGYDVTYLGARNLFSTFGLDGWESIDFGFTKSEFHAAVVAKGINALKSGRIVNTTGDGYSGASGQPRSFLGRQRLFPNGFTYMTVMANALAVPVFVQIKADGTLSVAFHPALEESPASADRSEKMNHLTHQYISLLQRVWRSDFGNVSDQVVKQFLRKSTETNATRATT